MQIISIAINLYSLSLEISINVNYNIPEIDELIRSKQFQDALHEEITNCIIQHQKIVAYCKQVEMFFSPVLFPGILFGMFYLIFTTFCVVIVSIYNTKCSVASILTSSFQTEDNQQLFTQIMYMMTSLNEMFVITFFAQMLTTEVRNTSCKLSCKQIRMFQISVGKTKWYHLRMSLVYGE